MLLLFPKCDMFLDVPGWRLIFDIQSRFEQLRTQCRWLLNMLLPLSLFHRSRYTFRSVLLTSMDLLCKVGEQTPQPVIQV